MEFKTQICTTKEQSKRLLELGLKKETADMVHQDIGATPYNVWNKTEIEDNFLPAWSLHRIIVIGDICGVSFTDSEKMFETCINLLAARIRFNLLNSEYINKK